jgi:hypothetical protein
MCTLQNMAERCRQLLMAPVALLRCCIFWVCVIAYGAREARASAQVVQWHALRVLAHSLRHAT